MNALLTALLLAAAADPAVAVPTPPTPPTPPSAPAVAEAPLPPPPAAQVAAPALPAEKPSDREALLKGQWPTAPRVSLDLERVKTREAIKRLAEAAKWGVRFKDTPRGRVDLVLADVPADEALLSILRDHHLQAERTGDLITISKRPEVEEEDEDEVATGETGRHSERVQIGSSVKVSEGETVRSAVSVGGDVEVDGTVLQDAVSVGGNVRLGPKAVVKHDAVSVGGTVYADPQASVGGDRVSVGLGAFTQNALPRKAPEKTITGWLMGLLTSIAKFALLFVFGLMLLAVVPERIRSIGRELRRAPMVCGAIGVVGWIALLPLIVLLAITVIGILAIPFLGIAVAVAVLMGATALAVEIGSRVPPQHTKRTQVLVLAFGVLALFVVSHIPILGGVVTFAVCVLSLGAALRTKFGNTRVDANFVPEP